MVINDRIYGKEEIDAEVLLALMESRPLSRLRKINQAGASQYLFPWKNVSRFEHSVGVMILLKRFGARLTEQVAGLLHDIPHTAFSHVADFVFQNERHEFHEMFHGPMIHDTEIAGILKKFKISLTVAHPERFGLLERKIPDLCADRIDYALRDYLAWKKDGEAVRAKFDGLAVYNSEFVFKNQYAAEAFASDYLDLDKHVWADPRETALYEILAEAIRHALEKGLLKQADFFTDDETVMHILKTKGDAYILKKLTFLTPSFRIEEAKPGHYHLYIKSKVRYVDPKIIKGKWIKRLSDVSVRFQKMLDAHIKQGKVGWYLNVYPK